MTMDTAGTIIGAISLSITLLQGVTTYCHDWKHQDEDVRALRSLSDGLVRHLQAIEQVVKDHPTLNPDSVTRLEDAAKTCNEHCEALILLAEKYGDDKSATSWKEKARVGARKLKFPFQKKTLQELKDVILAFRGNVDGILQLLSLENVLNVREITEERHEATIEEIRSTRDQVATEVGQQIAALETTLCRKLDDSATLVTTGANRAANTMFQSFAVEMNQTILPTQGASVVNSITREVHNSTTSIEASVSSSALEILSAIKEQSQMTHQLSIALASAVGVNSGVSMPVASTSDDSDDESTMAPRRRNKSKGRSRRTAKQTSTDCTCRYTPQRINPTRPSGSYGWIFIKQVDSAVHERDCPLWYQSRVSTKYDLRFAVLQRLGVFVSLNTSRSPYQSFFRSEISQNLSFKPIVPEASPAFIVISHYFHQWQNDVDVHGCLQDLMVVFQSGRGTPTDTLLDGTTLLQYAFKAAMSGRPSVSQLWALTRKLLARDSRISHDCIRNETSAWKGLHGQVLEHVSDFDEAISSTALSFFTWLTNDAIAISPPSEDMNLVQISPWGCRHQCRLVMQALRSQEPLRDAAGCGALSTAVLERDKPAVEKILSRCPELLTAERDVFGHTPIDHAIGWTEGLRLLLGVSEESAPRQVPNGAMVTSVDLSLAYGCAESTRLLLDAGLSFNMEWVHLVGTDVLAPEVSEMIAGAFVQRLAQLSEFAKKNLPAKVFASLSITETSPPDANARAFLDALHSEGIKFPNKFHTFYEQPGASSSLQGTMYHLAGLDHATVTSLIEAGLTNIDHAVEEITPLMCLSGPLGNNSRFFQVAELLVSHGARLDRKVPFDLIENPTSSIESIRQYYVLHRLCGIAWSTVRPLSLDDAIEVAGLGRGGFWQRMLQSDISDPCRCACAIGGCRPISLALKSVQPQGYVRWAWWENLFSPEHHESARRVLFNVAYLLGDLEGDQFAEDVIRYFTFTALGLTHTCCHYTGHGKAGSLSRKKPWIRLMETEGIEEIHKEQAALIEKLDHLVDGFMRDYQEQGICPALFLLSRWEERMFEELSPRDTETELVTRQWQEIGVVVSPEEPRMDEAYQVKVALGAIDELKEADQRAYEEWIGGIRRSIMPA